jgi:hypothetical protein
MNDLVQAMTELTGARTAAEMGQVAERWRGVLFGPAALLAAKEYAREKRGFPRVTASQQRVSRFVQLMQVRGIPYAVAELQRNW